MTYDYAVTEILRVVDGDTWRLRIDLGFYLSAALEFRLYGYDCPELTGHGGWEHDRATDALLATLDWFRRHLHEGVRVRTYKADSFGRWLAEAYVPGDPYPDGVEADLGPWLESQHLAVLDPHGGNHWREVWNEDNWTPVMPGGVA